MIRVVIPAPLRILARVEGEVSVAVREPITLGSVLDALEARHPVLCGTIRDRVTLRRRPFIRFFACEQDLSHHGWETGLPAEILSGKEPLLIIGAMAGG